jgi:hypothetical protein
MRHEEATAAIEKVRRWFGGALSSGTHVDAQVAHLIDTILQATQLSEWLHDNGSWRGTDSQKESVDLLWAIVQACDVDAIHQAITTAEEYANDVRSGKEPGRHSV